MDERLNILSRWIEGILGSSVELAPASADASFRRYFRVFCRDGRTYIAMDAPPEHESVEVFARTAARFGEVGLNVPVVHGVNEGQGFALLSDLGTRTYLAELDADNAGDLYDDALDALFRLQCGGRARLDLFPAYDHAELTREMELFRQWFVPYRTTHELSADDHATIDRTYRALAGSALEQPRVWVHRDFHSRNLMVLDTDNPGVLDFQDAVSGPVTYDLVSLLRDCYIVWPKERVGHWLTGYFERIRPILGDDAVTLERFTRWFDWMGVQRHIKVLGIFSRLYHRDGKAAYLDDLPVVYTYVRDVCGQYQELRPFRDLIESMPVQWTS
ncbi:MAG: phosphotransferase [Gammaproteobacteria bacterium]|nr:phosphotransferase [Gammaproteobacteria bacterium]